MRIGSKEEGVRTFSSGGRRKEVSSGSQEEGVEERLVGRKEKGGEVSLDEARVIIVITGCRRASLQAGY